MVRFTSYIPLQQLTLYDERMTPTAGGSCERAGEVELKKSRSSVSASGVFLNIPSSTFKQRNIHVTVKFVSSLEVDFE